MIHKNNLFINRLVVLTNSGKTAYDEKFHKGINIIRGKNSSGKSTISNFIFFILGGYFTDFVPEARKCSTVISEVEMNGAIFTIKRYIEINDRKVNPRVPMFIYWGDYIESKNPPLDKTWQKFDYNSYIDKKSFSNVLFDNLNIPIVKGDNNITIHQLLRLMYVDQDSPTSSLYYYEQFDSQITRETTAELLLGIYDEELYNNKRRLIELVKELDETKSQIKLTKGFFSDPLTLNPVHIQSKIENAQYQIQEIEEEIIRLKSQKSKLNKSDTFRYQDLSNKISKQREIVNSLIEKAEQINYEISDNEFFIETLNEKLKALKNSVITREFLNNFPLHYCPECLSQIKEEKNESKCKLCKETIDSSYGITQARRMEQEISFQINESNLVQKHLKLSIDKIKPLLKKETSSLNYYQDLFDEEVKDVKSSNQEKLEKLYIDKGFIEGEIMQFRTMYENAEYYSNMLVKRDELIKEKENIEYYIRITETKQNNLKVSIENQIKSEALYLLNNDLHRQDEFKNANDFHVDFSNNMAFLSNEYSKYSASSNFYLKITARFSLFLSSLSIPEMRYPRFILADNMEDKGIEEARAQNFQKILIERLSSFDSNSYQVIYTTSYITDVLNQSNYVVGDFYTKENRTLKNLD
ncbi:AAA family ATPase [Flavobacterium columnare]|uniref:AAA family ATPase n=1 Tax=Flavobacterium columnare TaxID=996 RepID=UPI003C2D5954